MPLIMHSWPPAVPDLLLQLTAKAVLGPPIPAPKPLLQLRALVHHRGAITIADLRSVAAVAVVSPPALRLVLQRKAQLDSGSLPSA